ncbi:MAG: hypothetical protein HYY40_10720, partial [Bacteroidetes bacterium]|nr:hypothetical protein [Bacteroidota bacterium]
FTIIFLSTVFISCFKKGEDDPFISLRTRKARIVGNWNVVEYSFGSNNYANFNNYGNSTILITFNSNYYYEAYTGSIYTCGPATIKFSIKKDGKFNKQTEILRKCNGNLDEKVITIETGTWDFLNGSGENKNKEYIIFWINEKKYDGPDGNYYQSYTGSKINKIFKIDLLKNNEAHLSREDTVYNDTIFVQSEVETMILNQ